MATDWRVRHKLLLYLFVFASGGLTKLQECCFYVDYLQGYVVFLLRVMRHMCVVRLSDGYMRGWQGLLCNIIMRSTPDIWNDLNQLLTQTVSGCLTNSWNNSCQDNCVTRLWPPPLKTKGFITEMSQFIKLYRVAFSKSILPTRHNIYPHIHTKYAFNIQLKTDFERPFLCQYPN